VLEDKETYNRKSEHALKYAQEHHDIERYASRILGEIKSKK
jgi:hypothetical protein